MADFDKYQTVIVEKEVAPNLTDQAPPTPVPPKKVVEPPVEIEPVEIEPVTENAETVEKPESPVVTFKFNWLAIAIIVVVVYLIFRK